MTRSSKKSDRLASGWPLNSISTCTRSLPTCRIGNAGSGDDWCIEDESREANKRLHLTGIPLRFIPAGEPARSLEAPWED